LLLARIALDEGDTVAAEALSSVALAQYESRGDAVVTASAWLVQAELAWRTGRPGEAVTRFQRAQSLRLTVKRPMSPRERARYEALDRRC
jgi:Flp pilus assembly protein TadD